MLCPTHGQAIMNQELTHGQLQDLMCVGVREGHGDKGLLDSIQLLFGECLHDKSHVSRQVWLVTSESLIGFH